MNMIPNKNESQSENEQNEIRIFTADGSKMYIVKFST